MLEDPRVLVSLFCKERPAEPHPEVARAIDPEQMNDPFQIPLLLFPRYLRRRR